MKPERLKELRKICDTADPGPWHYAHGYGFNFHPSQDGPPTKNTEFACAARLALPECLDEIENLHVENEILRKEITKDAKAYLREHAFSERLLAENKQRRERFEEIATRTHPEDDHTSMLETLRRIARKALKGE